MSTVKVVAHPETQAIITIGNNPEWGVVRVDAEALEFNNGIMNKRTRSAFIRGKVEDLKQVFTRAGQTMTGKIVRETSYEPFYANQKPVSNPTTGEVKLQDGKEVFQNYVFTTDLGAQDKFITSNTEVKADAEAGIKAETV